MRPDIREPFTHFLEHRLARITNKAQRSQFVKVPYVVDTPIARPYHGDPWQFSLRCGLMSHVQHDSMISSGYGTIKLRPQRAQNLAVAGNSARQSGQIISRV